jgi:hypothetical protein
MNTNPRPTTLIAGFPMLRSWQNNFRLAVSAMAGGFFVLAASAADIRVPTMPPGQVLVAKIFGVVTKTIGSATTPVTENSLIPQLAIINTGSGSNVALVFSNGATLQLGANTQLIIKEFVQDPFSGAIRVADLEVEPTISRTSLSLLKGDLGGEVKRLRPEHGSSFTVETPSDTFTLTSGAFRIQCRPKS